MIDVVVPEDSQSGPAQAAAINEAGMAQAIREYEAIGGN
jgi:hypothetical protein